LDLAKAAAVAELLRQSGGKESAALEIAPRPSSSEHHSASAQLNSATLSGAVDVVAVRQPDGSLRSTALHVRFGRLLAPFPSGLPVQLTVNEAHVEGLEDALRLGPDGAASHVPTPTELGRMGLMPGVNHLGFSCGGRPVVARLHVLAATDRVVISDVDGTITRSDLRGHVPRPLARLMLGDAQVRGVP
jgi:phosphatidate phosphatase LPIN